MFSLVGALASTPSAAPACSSFALFGRFSGTMTPSDSSPPCMRNVRPWPSPAGLCAFAPVNDEVSRFPCLQFLSVPGVYAYRQPPGSLAWPPAAVLPSPSDHRVGAPWPFDEARYPAHGCLCLRFSRRLTTPAARLEVRMVRYSFPVGLFHSLLHAGFHRRFRSAMADPAPWAAPRLTLSRPL